MLQCVAVCCSELQCVAVYSEAAVDELLIVITIQCVAVCCGELQCAVVYLNAAVDELLIDIIIHNGSANSSRLIHNTIENTNR